jgi:hypothetical protein
MLWFMFMSMGWDYISELQPQTSPLFTPRWYMSVESYGIMILTGEKLRSLKKTCPSVTVPITNPPWTNPHLCCERLVTNRLSYCMCHYLCYSFFLSCKHYIWSSHSGEDVGLPDCNILWLDCNVPLENWYIYATSHGITIR